MPDPYRRSIGELVTRYSYHPELRDLFVEGEGEVKLFKWFLSRFPNSRAVVYYINSVELAPDECQSAGINGGGNKGRVIALAKILNLKLPLDCRSVLCCADKDFDEFESILNESRYLIYTDYACLECYAMAAKSLSKLFDVYLRTPIASAEMDDMIEVLCFVFSVRLAKQRLAPTATWFERFTKCCSLRDGRIFLDKPGFLLRVVNVSDGMLAAERIDEETKNFAEQPLREKRLAMHGHDIVQLISWLARKKGVPKEIADPIPLGRALLQSIEMEDLQNEYLFQEVGSWACEMP